LEMLERPAIGTHVAAAARVLAATQPTPTDEAQAYVKIMSQLVDSR